MSEKELRIGIETELYLDPVDPTFNEKHRIFTPESLNDLAKDLVKSYNEQKEEPSTLACVTRIDDTEYEFGDEPEDSTGRPFWSVMSDITIWRSDKFSLPKEQRWPLELTSPILSYKASGHWRKEVSEHFETLKVFANIDVNKSCSKSFPCIPLSQEDGSVSA